jgi:hypothetical protein
MKQMVTSLFGMFGSAVALLFGGWDIALQTLVLFMGIDWITGGILLPVIFKKSPKSENASLDSPQPDSKIACAMMGLHTLISYAAAYFFTYPAIF